MKIECKKSFGIIPDGGCFRIGEDVFIKVRVLPRDEDFEWNAVNLLNGAKFHVEDWVKAIPVEAGVVVE